MQRAGGFLSTSGSPSMQRLMDFDPASDARMMALPGSSRCNQQQQYEMYNRTPLMAAQPSASSYHYHFGNCAPMPALPALPQQRCPQIPRMRDDSARCQSLHIVEPGMKEVPSWLKSLRLHKYTALLGSMTYDELLSLTEDALEARGVTQGARRKIAQNIDKLRRRGEELKRTEQLLCTPQSADRYLLCCAAHQLKHILQTPMRAYRARQGETVECVEGRVRKELISDENVPALFIRVLGQLHSCTFRDGNGGGGRVSEQMDDEALITLFIVYDRVHNNEAFTPSQKQLALNWKRTARKYVNPGELRRNRPYRAQDCCKDAHHHHHSQSPSGAGGVSLDQQSQMAMMIMMQMVQSQPQMIQRLLDDQLKSGQMRAQQQQQQQQQQQLREQQQRQAAAELQHRLWQQQQAPVPLLPPREERGWQSCGQEAMYQPRKAAPLPHTQQPTQQLPPQPQQQPSSLWSQSIYGSHDLLDLIQQQQRMDGPLLPPRDKTLMSPLKLELGGDASPLAVNDLFAKDDARDSHSSSSGYSSSSSDRASGAGSPRGIRVYDFTSNLTDRACIDLSDLHF